MIYRSQGLILLKGYFAIQNRKVNGLIFEHFNEVCQKGYLAIQNRIVIRLIFEHL